MQKLLVPLLAALLVLSAVGNVIAYERWSSSRPLITVNGDVIRRKDLDDRVDYLYAKTILQKLIWTKLIVQAAQHAHCMPSDREVSDDIALMERSTPAIVDRARATDPSLALFREDLTSVMALRNLRIRGITVTDPEVRRYYAANKPEFILPAHATITTVVAQDPLAAATAKALLQNGTDKTLIVGREGMSVVGIDAQISGSIPDSINLQILKLSAGQIGIYPIDGEYMVVRVEKRTAPVLPSCDSIKNQVSLAARLAKAPAAGTVLQGILNRATIHADSEKYKFAIPASGLGAVSFAQI